MKKILYFIPAVALGLSISSCNLDRMPTGSTEQKPYENYNDMKYNREGIYAELRREESMTNLFLPDIQSDLYDLTDSETGQYIGLSDWDLPRMLASDEIADYYGSFSRLTMQVNYFIMRTEEAVFKNKLFEGKASETKKADGKKFLAEARLMRAVAVYRLMSRFAKAYDPATADTDLGICLVKNYSPMTFLPRSTQKECYTYALQQIDSALLNLPDGGNNNGKSIPTYLTKDYANALKARICLQMQNYQGVIDAVGKFIDNYPLVDLSKAKTESDKRKIVQSTYAAGSSENLVRMYADYTVGTFPDFGSAPAYTRTDKLIFAPNFIPEQWVVNLYGAGDVRKGLYIESRGYYGGDNVFMLSKFCGDPAYNKDPKFNDFRNAVNLFNVAEAYLLRAEAAANLGNFAQAQSDMDALAKARGLDGSGISNPAEIMDYIKNERVRELIGEGVRLNDLMRWKMDMTRKGPQTAAADILKTKGGVPKTVPSTNQQFVWEFPLRDRLANKSVKENPNWKY